MANSSPDIVGKGGGITPQFKYNDPLSTALLLNKVKSSVKKKKEKDLDNIKLEEEYHAEL